MLWSPGERSRARAAASISNDGGSLNLGESTVRVTGNAAASGGGISCESTPLNAYGATILGNTASSSGGGLYLEETTQAVKLSNVKVSSNLVDATGVASGGGLFISGGTLNTNGIEVQFKIQAAGVRRSRPAASSRAGRRSTSMAGRLRPRRSMVTSSTETVRGPLSVRASASRTVRRTTSR